MSCADSKTPGNGTSGYWPAVAGKPVPYPPEKPISSNNPVAAQESAGISVVICCYNSASRLPETLKHLARQVVPDLIPWEVIVVNNASTDDTARMAQRLWDGFGNPAPFCVVEEVMSGLCHARERGIASAQHGVLVFLDDDNWLAEDYLRIAHQVMSEHERIGVLGGKIAAAFEIDPPGWFPQLQSCYAVGAQGRSTGDITDYKRHLAGAGMVLRKAAYSDLKARKFKFLLSGRTGKQTTSGEDVELCLALVLLGYRIWYDERLRLDHFIPRQRLTRDYALRLAHGNRVAGPVLACYESALNGSGASALRLYLRTLKAHSEWVLKSAVKLLLGRDTFTVFQLKLMEWWYSLLSLPELRRVFRLYHPRVIRLKQSGAVRCSNPAPVVS